MIAGNDAQTAAQIAYWDAGSPQYRWIDLISNRLLAATPTTAFAHRVYTYVALAMYDATIATWQLPVESFDVLDRTGGDARVLFPDRASDIRAIGKEAGDSRIWRRDSLPDG